MKVGDLVEIEKWCKNKGRRAIVTEVPEYLDCVKIVYLDTGGSVWILVTHSEDGKFVGQVHSWGKDHLEVISESR